MQRVLIIGGTTFMGYELVFRLLTAGAEVTVLNRGRHADPFGERVDRVLVDRTTPDFCSALRGREFDAVVDFAAFTAADAQGAVEALSGRTGHYIFISSGAAYLAGEGIELPCPASLAEADYPKDTAPAPRERDAYINWKYGADKRAAEAALITAYESTGFPATRLRLPIVNGARDPGRRLESYVWRIMDGGPVLLPDGGVCLIRHVYSEDVVLFIARILGQPQTFGEVFNLSQHEELPLLDLVSRLATMLGAPDRMHPVTREALIQAGLSLRTLSPFSGPWSSRLDPSRAMRDCDFHHQPLDQYLGKMLAAFLAHWPGTPPDGYESRSVERSLAHR